MIRVGIAGFGLMGRTHLNAYLADQRAHVVALADSDQSRLTAKAIQGNLQSLGRADFDFESAKRYQRFEDLLSDESIDAVSICTPTSTHVEMTCAALKAGKHVLVEKPLALSFADAERAVAASDACPDRVAMPAMCMRFWPAWTWLRDAIRDERYGKVMTATFTRLGSMPTWAPFYGDAQLSGGAILDLHIHDADFVRFCFGDPIQVNAWGHSETTAGVDHVITMYDYETGPPIVSAEGGWTMKPGFPFTMQYLVNFETATARFDLQADRSLVVHRHDGSDQAIELTPGEGYRHEISYFLNCISNRTRPELVTMREGAESVRLIDAERLSVLERAPVKFRRPSM